jgi:hypothetical protein
MSKDSKESTTKSKPKGKSALQKARETAPAKRTPAQQALILKSELKSQQAQLRRCEGQAICMRFVAKANRLRAEGHKKFDLVALD